MMKTQATSKERVADASNTNAALAELYEAYDLMGPTDFHVVCQRLVDESRGSVAKKLAIKASLLARSGSREKMLQTTSNYFLAGSGLGV